MRARGDLFKGKLAYMNVKISSLLHVEVDWQLTSASGKVRHNTDYGNYIRYTISPTH
jgi:hypothetical protein